MLSPQDQALLWPPVFLFSGEPEGDAAGNPFTHLEDLTIPQTHQERLEWVRQSYERFFEKVLEWESFNRIVPAEVS